MEPHWRCHFVVLACCCLALLKEGHAQSEFGLDATVDNFAAGGVMGMTGSMPGQGASFISAESKASEEIRIVAAAGNGSLCWGVVDARLGLQNRVVGLQPCSARAHSQKWLLRRTGSTLQIHPALFTQECLELAKQPGTGREEVGGELEWSRLQTGSCQARHSALAARQSFKLDSKRRLTMGTNQNLCIAATGDKPGSVFLAVVCDESHLQRLFMPAHGKFREGSSWFTELLYGGSEEPRCLSINADNLLGVEECRYSGLALSRQLFTVLGGGNWVLLQPSAQWGKCIGLEHVKPQDRGGMHEEARAAGHHIVAQPCSNDYSGQAWIFDEWDRLRIPDTDWCISAPIASGGKDGLVSLQACSHSQEQRFFVHPHQIIKQVAPDDTAGRAYGLGRGSESATLFGPYPSTPRVHAPAAPGAGGTAGPEAGSTFQGEQMQWPDGVRRTARLADGSRRSDQDAPAVSQDEFVKFCRQAVAEGASISTLQAAGCPADTSAASTSPTSINPSPVPVSVPSPPSPIQQQPPPATLPPSPFSDSGAAIPPSQRRPPPTWKRKSPPYNSNQDMGSSSPPAGHQQRHLQEDPATSQPVVKKQHGFLSRHVDVHTMHEHEVVHYLLLGGCGVLLLAAAFLLIRVRLGQPRRLRKVPGPMQMIRNASQRKPARIVPRPPALAGAAAEDDTLSPTAHARMIASRGGRFNSIPGLRSAAKARGAGNGEQGQFNL
ncbi:hypothetical protein WJX84_005367 [Apatococcus fuscideae]|uniref:Ricin B lectin domain-containing protein n=1 Tax=Apatococcus fuscideae TaxID=2026836 RepID=A0AAW1TDN9_9CHLO